MPTIDYESRVSEGQFISLIHHIRRRAVSTSRFQSQIRGISPPRTSHVIELASCCMSARSWLPVPTSWVDRPGSALRSVRNLSSVSIIYNLSRGACLIGFGVAHIRQGACTGPTLLSTSIKTRPSSLLNPHLFFPFSNPILACIWSCSTYIFPASTGPL